MLPLGRAPAAPNSTLVVMWTQPDGGGAWATDAAAELVNVGLFDDPDAAELSLVAFGDAYVDNAYSCEMGGTWTAAAAACWLANCSEPWPPTKGMTSADCYGYPAPGEPVCKLGTRECDLMRWQAFVWLHYLLIPATATPFYACLQSGAANASLSSADAVAEVCAARVGASDFARLRDHYVHTWRGAEALAGNAQVQSFHLRRADAEHGPAWPFIQIGQGGYSGPHTFSGLKRAICASIEASAGAAKQPAACRQAI